MFSARKFMTGGFILEISSEPVCRTFEARWPTSGVSNTEFKIISGSDCYYKFLNRTGLEFLAKKICNIDKNAKLKIGPLNEPTEPLVCESN